jgi:hypothetical protein
VKVAGARLARHLKRHRDKFGTPVLFNGVEYRCTVESVSGAKAGAQTLSHLTLDMFVASADPHVFSFSPTDFYPTTNVIAPQEGDILIWHSLDYVVTDRTFGDVADDDTALLCYALRRVWET